MGKRVIIHLDLDCFYAQVEHRRLNIPKAQPLAVQQYSHLIAVNYPARKVGINRHATASEAKLKCGDIVLVHVEMVDNLVSLERYRDASGEIFEILHRFQEEGVVVERASIDEAYLDVTDMAEKKINHHYLPELEQPVYNKWKWSGNLFGASDRETLSHENDEEGDFNELDDGDLHHQMVLLYWGAKIAQEIRDLILSELDFTCSAGISHNKMFSKMASSKFKPDQQTIVPPAAVPAMIYALPISKIRLLGGKLGQSLTDLGFKTAGDLQAVSVDDLCAKFGPKTGQWLYSICRGVDSSLVVQREELLSAAASKSFNATHSQQELSVWLKSLASELAKRLDKICFKKKHDSGEHVTALSDEGTSDSDSKAATNILSISHSTPSDPSLTFENISSTPSSSISSSSSLIHSSDCVRVPKTLTLHFRNATTRKSRSRSCPMPPLFSSPEAIFATATNLFAPCVAEALPCNCIGLSASNFTATSVSAHSITAFFTPSNGDKFLNIANVESAEKRTVGENGRLSESSQQRSIARFLNVIPTSSAQEEHGSENRFECPKCKKQIPESQSQEHSDHHYAQDLQWQISKEFSKNVSSPVSSEKPQKRKARSDETPAKGTLHQFFKPTMQKRV